LSIVQANEPAHAQATAATEINLMVFIVSPFQPPTGGLLWLCGARPNQVVIPTKYSCPIYLGL
jgi:hypothetical protein